MNPNHNGLAKSIYQQELTMMSQYLSYILRGDLYVTSAEYHDGGTRISYIDNDTDEEGHWDYPSDMNTFMHEQLVRMITAEYSDLDH